MVHACGAKAVKRGFDRYRKQRYLCKGCNAIFGEPKLKIYRGVLKEKSLIASIDLIERGYSNRAVARLLHLQPKTARRYREIILAAPNLNIAAPMCQCGKPAQHKGWCPWRVSQSPAKYLWYQRCAEQSAKTRAIRLASVTERCLDPLLVWPYLRDLSHPEFRLLRLVNDSVPRTLPEHVRADVCQEILTAVISGEISDHDVPAYVPTFTKRVWSQQSNRFRERSLDSLVTTSGRRLVEVIAG